MIKTNKNTTIYKIKNIVIKKCVIIKIINQIKAIFTIFSTKILRKSIYYL